MTLAVEAAGLRPGGVESLRGPVWGWEGAAPPSGSGGRGLAGAAGASLPSAFHHSPPTPNLALSNFLDLPILREVASQLFQFILFAQLTWVSASLYIQAHVIFMSKIAVKSAAFTFIAVFKAGFLVFSFLSLEEILLFFLICKYLLATFYLFILL